MILENCRSTKRLCTLSWQKPTLTLKRCVKHCIYWTQCSAHFHGKQWAGLKGLDFLFLKWLARFCVFLLHFGWYDLDDTYSKGILSRRYSSSHGCQMIVKQEPSTIHKRWIRAVILSQQFSAIPSANWQRMTQWKQKNLQNNTCSCKKELFFPSSLTSQKLLQN